MLSPQKKGVVKQLNLTVLENARSLPSWMDLL